MLRNAFVKIGMVVILLCLLTVIAESPRAATFTVTNANDAGSGSLRNAINSANANLGNDLIDFNIPSTGPFTIVPATPLPALTDANGVTIDGLTQPGATPGLTPPATAHLIIEISGFTAGLISDGLVIHSSNNVIKGLVINRFSDNGIFINGGNPLRTDNNFIYCNFIGTDTSGTIDLGNGTSTAALYAGVYITAGGPGDQIAMDNVVDACLISGNYAEGVSIVGAHAPGDVYQNRVNNCFIGTDISGVAGIGNDHEGVCICEGAHDNVVEFSIICDNKYDGVGIQGYAPDMIYTYGNRVYENFIGVNVINQTLGNNNHGVSIGMYGPNHWGFARYNTVGPNNIIAYNGGDGVCVWEDSFTVNNGDYNEILENSTYDNGGLGIDLNDDGVTPNDATDLDDWANRELNFPNITSATTITVKGTLNIDGPEDQARVEVFKADPDPTAHGEGRDFIGSTVPDAAGNWSLAVVGLVAVGDTVTATATDSLFETSEFCPNYPVSLPYLVPIPGVIWHILDWWRPPDGVPLGTEWFELYPGYSRTATLSAWSDNGDDILSFCDTIFMENPQTGLRNWFHVERVTPTIKMVQTGNDEDTIYMEGLNENPLIDPLEEPLGTFWHGVHPQSYFCTTWEIIDWEDNGTGALDSCDFVTMTTDDGATQTTFHIEGFQTDIITTPLPTPADEYDHNLDGYIPEQGDPTGTQWHELYPDYNMTWDLAQWWDNGDGFLSYCDTILFSNVDADSFLLKHIEEVTLTIELSIPGGPEATYMDLMGGYMAGGITDPTGLFWHQVYPVFCQRYVCIGWDDNGTTVLDSCDYIVLESIDGADSGTVYNYHVEGVETDIITTYLPYSDIDTCEYYKAPYEDYAPNGMPDFDQKQDSWYLNVDPTKWTHCGPVALANCFWWFDSKFEPNPIDPRPFWPGPGSPGLNDGYPLVQSFDPTGGWDDHDTLNVMPFVDSLARYCNTNSALGPGTNVHDLVSGAGNWLNSRGLLEDYTITVIPGEQLEYEHIREEVYASQDVILLLGFWEDDGSLECHRVGGHYVTVAGACLSSASICISDPYYDYNEGEPPVSPHGASVHNDAYYVSGPHGTIHHDRYDVVSSPPPCTALPYLWLPDYPITPADGQVFAGQNEGDIANEDYLGGSLTTLIEYAVIICPADTCTYQYPGDANTSGGLDDADILYLLDFLYNGGPAPNPLANGDPNGDCRIDKGDVFYLEAYFFLGGPAPVSCTCVNPDTVNACCYDYTGNTNCSHDEEPDISDITRLIDYLYHSHDPLCCRPEADVNGSGDPEPDISDITKLIDFLYLTHTPLPLCP